MPGLVAAATRDAPELDGWQIAIAVAETIDAAASDIGPGPYGDAVRSLLGTQPLTRGLLLPARRRAAASELNIAASTLVRHREKEMLEDLAVTVYASLL